MSNINPENFEYHHNKDGSWAAEYNVVGCVPVIAEGWTKTEATEAALIAMREIYNLPTTQH